MKIQDYQRLPLSVLSQHSPTETITVSLEGAYQSAGLWDKRLVLVLDDDPTGVETVHDVYVYLQWSKEILLHIFKHERLAFIQTNTRSFPEKEAVQLTQEIIQLALAASREIGRDFTVISRSDSSLQGHYPAETDTIRELMESDGKKVDGEIICFFLPEAGHYTIDNVHYIKEGDTLVPVSDTEFAQDAVFCYQHADLTHYIEEKTRAAIQAEEVLSIPLSLLRQDAAQKLLEIICAVTGAQKIVVNCSNYQELKHFVTVLKAAEQKGKRFLFRTAASFVKIYGYITDRPLLMAADLFSPNINPRGSVLTIVGSHTTKSTIQLQALLTLEGIVPIELSVAPLLADKEREEYIGKTVLACEKAMYYAQHPVIFTSRKVIQHKTLKAEENLQISQKISYALADIVNRLSLMPKAIIAKGGITSSDVTLKGLGINQALILGQIRPSIPVIRTGDKSKFPGLPYVIFPGNTGAEDDLKNVWLTLRGNP